MLYYDTWSCRMRSTATRHQSKAFPGFTIVELLIVVVIIAILAAITLVTYNGIQQRANNAAIIDAASKSLRMIQAYIAANDKYPLAVTGNSCITITSGCVVNNSTVSANSTFEANIASIGTLPRSIPMGGSNQYGIWYTYTPTRTFNGSLQPALLVYWVHGVGQPCGLSDVIGPSWSAGVPSTTGYTVADDNSLGRTLCYIHIQGPSA